MGGDRATGEVAVVPVASRLVGAAREHIWFVAYAMRAVVYLSHFFVSLVVAGVLWRFAHERFRRFAVVFVSLTFLAFLTYALYPAVPPWLASKQADLGPTSKIVDEMWVHVGLRSGASVL